MKLNKIGEVWNSANRLLHVSDLIGLLSPKNFATMATWRNDFSSLLLTPKGDYTKTFWKFLNAHQVIFRPDVPSETKIYNFHDETTSIPVTFIRETPRILTKVGGLHDQYSFCLQNHIMCVL